MPPSFSGFVLKSRKHKAIEFLAEIKKQVKDWPCSLDCDFLDYMRLAETSESHKYDSIDTVCAEVVWPMMNGSYFILREDHPIAYASWGLFSQKASDLKLSAGRGSLLREDYNSGQVLWLLDVIAPYGHAKTAIKKLLTIKPSLSSGNVHFRRWYGEKNKERVSRASC